MNVKNPRETSGVEKGREGHRRRRGGAAGGGVKGSTRRGRSSSRVPRA